MREYKIEITSELEAILENAIRKKKDVIKLLLAAVSLLTYGTRIDRPTKDHLVLRIDKMKRLFVVQEHKITTFNFPFGVEENPLDNKVTIFDPLTDMELDGANLAILRNIFYELIDSEDFLSLKDLDSDLEKIMDSFDKHTEKDRLWSIMKYLMEFEVGYLRFDYDLERKNGRMHPLNHLDINYSTGVTYKIGLNSKKSVTELIDILDLNTECSFISN